MWDQPHFAAQPPTPNLAKHLICMLMKEPITNEQYECCVADVVASGESSWDGGTAGVAACTPQHWPECCGRAEGRYSDRPHPAALPGQSQGVQDKVRDKQSVTQCVTP